MYNTFIRDINGKILGVFGDEFMDHYDEEEYWCDIKIPPDEIIFPKHNDYLPGEVKIYHISELK